MGFFSKIGTSIKAAASPWLPSLWASYGNPAQGGQVDPNSEQGKKNLSMSIAPVQLQRVKQDVKTWRDAMDEAENPWYPHRVKQQRCFIDTVLNGHVFACMDRREKMLLQKKHRWVDKTSESREVNKKLTDLFNKPWFNKARKIELEAQAFGYNLISFGDCVNSDFPKLDFIKRWNVSPDRLNIPQFIYSISGPQFLEPPYNEWHLWIPTPSDVGVSRCGYGYLYKVAFYEIVARNVLTQNLDTTEMYGAPMRVGKTNKSQDDPERAIFEAALAEMGNMGYIVMDANGDDIQLVESKSLGNGYKIYESLEMRCEKKISKIILGHADALDSIPGKLGNDSEESPAQVALRETNTSDMNRQHHWVNEVLAPFLNENFGFMIDLDKYEWEFDNNEEEAESEREETEDADKAAGVMVKVKQAGGEPDWDWYNERTGMKVEKAEIPLPMQGGFPGAPGAQPKPGEKPEQKTPTERDQTKDKAKIDPKVKARLEYIYKSHKH